MFLDKNKYLKHQKDINKTIENVKNVSKTEIIRSQTFNVQKCKKKYITTRDYRNYE